MVRIGRDHNLFKFHETLFLYSFYFITNSLNILQRHWVKLPKKEDYGKVCNLHIDLKLIWWRGLLQRSLKLIVWFTSIFTGNLLWNLNAYKLEFVRRQLTLQNFKELDSPHQYSIVWSTHSLLSTFQINLSNCSP